MLILVLIGDKNSGIVRLIGLLRLLLLLAGGGGEERKGEEEFS